MSSNFKDEFYDIPGYRRYAVSPTGMVLNKGQNTLLAGSTNPDGYVNYRLRGDSGETYTWGRHRLMAFVFKHPGVDVDALVVNHINTIKGDDRLDNLEWVTYQGNAEHAGLMGLTEKCSPISVRDAVTGEVTKFPSIIECARAFGFTKDAVNYRVKAGEQRVFPERKQYRLSHGEEPWYVPENLEVALMRNSTSKKVLVRLVLTGEVYAFEKMTDLADKLCTPVSTLSLWLDQPDQPVLPGLIQLKRASDMTPWRHVTDAHVELDRYTGKRSVRTVNDRTGETRVFSSAVECAKEMNLSPTALSYRLKSEGRQVFSDGYKYSYYSVSV